IRGVNNRDVLRAFGNAVALLLRMSGRADDERLFVSLRQPADFIDRVGVTKIDQHIRARHVRLDVVADIAGSDDVDLSAILFRKIDNRLSHSARRADEQHANRFAHLLRSNSSRVLRNFAWFASVISHKGNRTSPDMTPRHARTVFTGTGFGSINKSLNRRNILRCVCSADFVSPAWNALTNAHTCDGNAFDATLTTPTAPADMKGSVSESSPLKIVNASGNRLRNSLTRSTLPLASLIDMIFLHASASLTTVSAPMSTPHRPGML